MNAAQIPTQCATQYAKRLLAWSLACCLIGAPAFAGTTDISNAPLASGAQSVSPNLLFTLDDSGSMDWDFLPDYVGEAVFNDNNQNTCMTRSDGTVGTGSKCSRGDPPYDAGGEFGFNGVAYDPNLYYAPGVDSTGAPYINPPSGTLAPTSVTDNAYEGGSNRNLTTYIKDKTFCNANGVCKRNGADSAGAVISGTDGQGNTMVTGQFPYRTNPSNSSTAIFGLPEMMSIGSFARSSSTVTATTVEAHGLTTSDYVYVTTSQSGLNATCGAVTSVSTNSFTFTSSGSGTITARTGSYRKCAQASFQRASSTVTVTTSTPHGLVVDDVITVAVSSNTAFNVTSASVASVPSTTTFEYTTGASGAIASTAGYWVRNGLYNVASEVTGPPHSYWITPVEYCTDENLTDCVQVLPGAEQPAGYTHPAYVRFCQTQAQALAPGGVGDSTGTPRCRRKFVKGLSGVPDYWYPRYGWFNRDTIASTVTSYGNRPNRTDCTSAPTCSYDEEIQNYARWFAYYRTRMQMMKTAVGRAFLPFISNPPTKPNMIRVGFITINAASSGSVAGSEYLKIADFNASHASSLYTKFYAVAPGSGTPLRQALSRAGWIFAGKLGTGLTNGIPAADDPMQASCQRNYSLLTTDGYWNAGTGDGKTLGNDTMGNMDHVDKTIISPYTKYMVDRTQTGTLDGVGATTGTSQPQTITQQVVCNANNTTTFGADINGTGVTTETTCGCASGENRIKQRTIEGTSINGATPTSWTATFQDYTACSPAPVITTTTPKTEQEQVVCLGSSATTFTAGGNGGGGQSSCGCSAGEAAVVTRTLGYDNVVVSVAGVQTSNTNSANTSESFSSTACAVATLTGTTVRQSLDCVGSGTVTFLDGTSKSCSCNGSRHQLIRETLSSATVTVTLNPDGTVSGITSVSGGTASYRYSKDGSNWQSSAYTGNNCASSGTTLTPTGPTASGGTLTPAVTLSPNPEITSGTSATTTTGTVLAITLSPNPTAVINGTETSTTIPGGTSNTLADVAMYYYQTDLRGGTDVNNDATGPSTSPSTSPANGDIATNNLLVSSSSEVDDFVTAQHMVTFSIGMADGLMRYQPDYAKATSGDFYNIKIGAQDKCFWASGTCNWPAPVGDTQSALDDLWHAAVNGRGQYYQALNANALDQGLQGALSAMGMRVAAAAASATSSPNVTQTNNSLFSTTFETNTWSGKVFAQSIDPVTGGISDTHLWDADSLLLAKVTATSDTRNIYTFDSSATTRLKDFRWGSLTTSEQAYFADKCVSSLLAQCATLSGAQLTDANNGENMVNFLRGHTGLEATVYRDRTFVDPNTNVVYQTVLGDTMDAKPIFVGKPNLSYADSGYSSFVTDQANRTALVYVGANDGYLHAFNATTGVEAWAYTPKFLMPGLYQLADTAYGNKHVFYVDGSPTVGDVYDSTATAWKTILVGGVNGGGKGFYALDVTDPANPKGLWEFCADSAMCALNDADLGFSFGNPLIGKRASDGKWIVVLTSGLNNASGVGYFFILDAITGAVLDKTATIVGGVSVGTPSTPSGLMKASAYRNAPNTDGSFSYIYAGDQLGNVWRLDLTGASPVVTHMAALKDATGRAQPITTRPEMTLISGSRVLYIGTGRYLGTSDLSDPGAGSGIAWQQSLYAFKDKNGDYGTLRSDSTMVAQYMTDNGSGQRTVSSNPVDWTSNSGWYIDFNPGNTSPGERVNIDPQLVLGTLIVLTNIPEVGSSCSVGGSSMKYDFNYASGSAISGQTTVGYSLGGSIVVGMAVVQLPSGVIKAIVTMADTNKKPEGVSTNASSGAVKRFSYRER